MNKNNQKTSSQAKSISTNTLIIAQEEEKGLQMYWTWEQNNFISLKIL